MAVSFNRVLAGLSPSFLTSMQANIDQQLIEHYLFGTHSELVSQTSPCEKFPYCNFKLFKNSLASNNQITFRLPQKPSKNLGILSQLPESCKQGNNATDTVYASFLKVDNDADVKIREIHQMSMSWWKMLINKPLSLTEKPLPKCYEILYDPSPSTAKETSFVVEKTWIDSVDMDDSDVILICNIRSTLACMNAFLQDSFASVDGYDYLKLHRKFAPIQACVIVDPEMQHDVQEILNSLLTTFHREKIRFDFSDCSSVNKIFEENDMKGIPFSIILSDSSVSDGVVHVRDRNTHFIEPMNLKNVLRFLKLNLHFQV